MENENRRIEELLNTGTEIAGAAVGGALGFFALGPDGAAGAAVAGVAITKSVQAVIRDISNRQLSKREEIRVGAASVFALARINSYLQNGKRLRQDDFFEINERNTSNANEVFEGVLLKSKNEHEERKIKLLGNAFANIAFMEDVTTGEANFILRLVERMTYRQLCMLALLKKKDQIEDLSLRKNNYADIATSLNFETVSILQEIYDLNQMGLVLMKMKDSSEYHALLDWGYIEPNELVLSELGLRIYNILNLDEILLDDILKVSLLIS